MTLRLRRLLAGCAVAGVASSAHAQSKQASHGVVQGITIRIADSAGLLQRATPTIIAALDSTIRRVVQVLPVKDVTVVVIADRQRAIAGYGVGGFTPSAFTVNVFVDPAYVDSTAVLAPRLAQTAAHELHHAARWRGPGYGRTLLEAMITEGLAERFADDLLRIPPPAWARAIPKSTFAAFLAKAAPEFDRPDDHARWFFGSTADVPRWTGYTIGYQLVADYLERHPGQSAATLVAASANDFRPGDSR